MALRFAGFLVSALLVVSWAETGPRQLRGSAVDSGSGLPSAMMQSTHCGCQGSTCDCVRNAGVDGTSEEQQQLESKLLERAQALVSLWQKVHGSDGQLQCSCVEGSETCRCAAAAVAGVESAEETNGTLLGEADALETEGTGAALESNSTLGEAAKEEAEQALSLWWAAGGGYHRGWGYGPHCGHAGYGGCGCHYYGCHCGDVHYGGCGWR